MAKGSKCQNCRLWAKAIFSICGHVSITRAYYMFSLWLYLLATDVAKRSKRQNFAYLLWQKEVTAITTADGSNYLIVLVGYVLSPMAERSRIVSQPQMMLYLGQPMSTNVFWWRYTVFVRYACVSVFAQQMGQSNHFKTVNATYVKFDTHVSRDSPDMIP